MQRIERYGVIALVLLLVTIAAVSFWDDGTSTEAAERGGDQRQERLAQNTGRPVAPSTRPKPKPKSPSRDAALRDSGAKRSNTRSASITDGPAVSGGRSPRTTPGTEFKTVEPKVAPQVIERPDGEEFVREQESNNVEFPKLDPDPRRDGRGAPVAYGDRVGRSSAGERTALDLANEAGTTPGGRPTPVSDGPKTSADVRPAPKPTAKTYTVKAGDSLSGIASRELGTKDRLGELLALNGITNPDLIFEGQVLKLPSGGAPVSSLRTVVTNESKEIPPAGPASGVYVVKGGEVLGVIAQRELGSAKRYTDIVALNPGLDADRILEGMRLRMPSDWRAGSVVASAEPQRAPRSTRRSSAPSTKSNKVR